MSDTLSGVLTLVFGTIVLLYSQTFPAAAGQVVGPSVFPSAIGAGLMACGAALAVSGLRRGRAPWLEAGDWMRRPRMVLNFALVVTDLVCFPLVVDGLGFFLTSFVFLAVLLFAFGARRAWIVPIGLAVTLAMHYGFYTLLRVPLPWGVLEGIAW